MFDAQGYSDFVKNNGGCQMKRIAGCVITATALLAISAAHAAPLTVYSNDFDGTVTGTGILSGAANSIESKQSLPAPPFSGNILRNSSVGPVIKTTLTLAGLPAHSSIDVNFLLAFIDSWDSTDGVGFATPDFFNVDLNGVNIFQATAANGSGTVTYSGGTDLGPGCNNYGFNTGPFYYCDRAFDVGPDGTLTVANSATNVTLDFYASGAGWQGGTDESWGIDNLQVVVNTAVTSGVPEPSSLALLGAGLLGLARFRRRSRAK